MITKNISDKINAFRIIEEAIYGFDESFYGINILSLIETDNVVSLCNDTIEKIRSIAHIQSTTIEPIA